MSKYNLKTVSTIAAVRQALETEIFSLVFQPGSRLTENELADHYGVSRNTIREAMTPLIENGVLVKEANKGVFIPRITIKDIREIFYLREVLEKEAAAILCEKQGLSSQPEELLEKIVECGHNNDWIGSLNTDILFHESLVNETGNSRLIRLYQAILFEVKMCIFQSHSLEPLRRENASEHRKILDAIEQKNKEQAQALLSDHIEKAIKDYESVYTANYGENP